MKYPICLLCFTMFVSSAHAQYYYRDLLVPAQAGVQLQLYKKQHIKVITLHSFESTGEATENFKGRDRKSTRLNSSHSTLSRMPSSA